MAKQTFDEQAIFEDGLVTSDILVEKKAVFKNQVDAEDGIETTHITMSGRQVVSGQIKGNDGVVTVNIEASGDVRAGGKISGEEVDAEKGRVGDIGGGDYTEIEPDGTVVSKGEGTTWDDIYVSPTALDPLGAVAYIPKQFKNDGVTGSGSAISLDAVDQYGLVLDYANLDVSGNWAVEFWARPNNDSANTAIHRTGYFDIEFRNNQRFSFDGPSGTRVVSGGGTVLIGVWQHFAVVGTDVGGGATLIDLYVDGQLVASGTRAFSLAANANDLYIGSSSTPNDYFDGDIDELILYNVALTESQVQERFNNGSGTINPATGITPATDYTAYFKFDEGTGTTSTNSATLGTNDANFPNSVSWVDGVIGQSENLGVFLPAFEPNKLQAGSFDMPVPHSWENGTPFHPHVHISTKEVIPAGSKIALSFEYSWIEPNGIFPDTIVDDKIFTFANEVPAYSHIIVEFDTIDTTSVSDTAVSPHMACSFSRKGFEVDDTFAEDIFLLNFGLHYISNMLGSRQEYVK